MIFIDQLIILGAKYLYLLLLAIAFLFFLKQSRNIQRQIIFFGVIVLPIVYAVAKLISFFYYDPRPFVQNNFVPLIPHKPDNGFPSDHALLSAAVSAVIFRFNKKWGAVLWVMTILVGLSRVFSGIHHFIDIEGSIVIAAGIAFLIYKIIRGRGILFVIKG